MEFPGKSCLSFLLLTYIVNVSYGYPQSPSYTGTFNPQFSFVPNTFGNLQSPSVPSNFGNLQSPSVPNNFGNLQSPSVPNTFGNLQSPSVPNTLGGPQFPSNANRFGSSQSSPSDTSNYRSLLFPSAVQDFVEYVFQNLIPFFSESDSSSIRNLSADQLFSIFYDLVYSSRVESGNPNAAFHSLSKAQSIKENYDKVDGKFLLKVIAYTTGELLLQNEILKEGNQKRLADLFAKDLLESIQSAPKDPESRIRASHAGFVNFLRSQGLATKTKAFIPQAVYVEVINALSKNYQIPFDPSNFNNILFRNPSNLKTVG